LHHQNQQLSLQIQSAIAQKQEADERAAKTLAKLGEQCQQVDDLQNQLGKNQEEIQKVHMKLGEKFMHEDRGRSWRGDDWDKGKWEDWGDSAWKDDSHRPHPPAYPPQGRASDDWGGSASCEPINTIFVKSINNDGAFNDVGPLLKDWSPDTQSGQDTLGGYLAQWLGVTEFLGLRDVNYTEKNPRHLWMSFDTSEQAEAALTRFQNGICSLEDQELANQYAAQFAKNNFTRHVPCEEPAPSSVLWIGNVQPDHIRDASWANRIFPSAVKIDPHVRLPVFSRNCLMVASWCPCVTDRFIAAYTVHPCPSRIVPGGPFSAVHPAHSSHRFLIRALPRHLELRCVINTYARTHRGYME